MVVQSIRDLLEGHRVVGIDPGATLAAACEVMAREKTSAVMVLQDHVLVGLVSERDVIRHVSQRGGLETALVGDVMTREVQCVETRNSIPEALARMKAGGFRHLPVLDMTGKVVGMLSLSDIPGRYCQAHETYVNWSRANSASRAA